METNKLKGEKAAIYQNQTIQQDVMFDTTSSFNCECNWEEEARINRGNAETITNNLLTHDEISFLMKDETILEFCEAVGHHQLSISKYDGSVSLISFCLLLSKKETIDKESYIYKEQNGYWLIYLFFVIKRKMFMDKIAIKVNEEIALKNILDEIRENWYSFGDEIGRIHIGEGLGCEKESILLSRANKGKSRPEPGEFLANHNIIWVGSKKW